jgi:hypothetical protein
VHVHAVALHDAGRRVEAVKLLEALAPKARGGREVLLALAASERDAGAERYLRELAAINFEVPTIAQGRAGVR